MTDPDGNPSPIEGQAAALGFADLIRESLGLLRPVWPLAALAGGALALAARRLL